MLNYLRATWAEWQIKRELKRDFKAMGIDINIIKELERTGRAQDFNEAVWAGNTEAADDEFNMAEAALEGPTGLHTTALRLAVQFEQTGRMEHLERAIMMEERAIEGTQQGDPNQAAMLNNLANMMHLRFEQTSRTEDLSEAIEKSQQAVEATPKSSPSQLARRMNNLANLIITRFKRTGREEDLEEAIYMINKAIEIAPRGDRNLIEMRSNLAGFLGVRFESTGAIEDLEKGIHMAEEVLKATLEGDPDLPGYFHNLGNMLGLCFQRMGNIEDLEKASFMAERAIETSPKGHPDLTLYQNSLVYILENQFKRMGKIEDLEMAIQKAHHVIETTPKNHINLPLYQNNLGNMLVRRYTLTERMEDLEESIRMLDLAAKTIPDDHPAQASILSNLSNTLENRFKRTGDVEALEKAIEKADQAVKTTPDDHPDLAMHQYNLGIKLCRLFKLTDDFHQSVAGMSAIENAVDATPEGHPDLAMYLHGLASSLGDYFGFIGDIEVLNEGVSKAKQAVDYTPEGHPDLSNRLNTLGWMLERRFEQTGNRTDLEEATTAFATSAESSNSPPLYRVLAGRSAGLLCVHKSKENADWPRAYNFFRDAVKLLPRVSPRSLSRDDQQYSLSGFSGLSSLAASAALQTNKPCSEALAVLEAGRGIMAGLVIDARSDVSDLKQEHPDLHIQYIELRDRVSTPLLLVDRTHSAFSTLPTSIQNHKMKTQSLSAAISRHRKDVQELEELERHIRTLEGFEQFQLGLSPTQLEGLSEGGPIVTFNVTEHRSDAFIVANKTIKVLQLPDLRHEELETNLKVFTENTKGSMETFHERNEQLRTVLAWIWKLAVGPVLKDLHMLSNRPGRKPRIWWVTSGLVGLVPLHAAGRGKKNTSSYVVSSYIPTFKALAYARWKSSSQPLSPLSQTFLVVSMPKTTGSSDLNTEAEVSAIKQGLSESKVFEIKTLDTPSKAEVMEHLTDSIAVYFACHGVSVPQDPSSSCLLLRDGRDRKPERLTVRELIDRSPKQAQLAYLSACSTSENLSRDLMDEVIHVASAFQLIGFPHVIGTFWEVDDVATQEVARTFVRILAENLIKSVAECSSTSKIGSAFEDVAYALHDSVEAVRQSQGPDNITDWAPFMHLGC